MTEAPILETRHLTKHFPAGGELTRRLRGHPPRVLVAVEDVSLAIRRGETVGLVGESGSGKSTFGRLLLQLHKPTSGEILFEGQSVLGQSARRTRELRKRIQVIFQDPYSSLNPTMTVGQMLDEALAVHRIVPKAMPGGARAPSSSSESGSRRSSPAAYLISSAADNASASASRARSRSTRSSSSPTSRLGARCLGARAGDQPADAGCRRSSG